MECGHVDRHIPLYKTLVASLQDMQCVALMHDIHGKVQALQMLPLKY